MAMTKKDFVALADAIRYHNATTVDSRFGEPFTKDQLDVLAIFCQRQNPEFKRERWLGYIAGENAKNGGAR